MSAVVQLLIGGLTVGSIYGLIAIGFTTVYSATGIVNFAQGDFAMLGALSAISLHAAGLPLFAAVIAAIILVGLVAVLIERVAIRPLGSQVTRGIIVTIGIGVILQGAAVLLWGTDAQPLPAFSGARPLSVWGATVVPQTLWIFGTAGGLMLLLYLFFERTYPGKVMRAAAINPFAAELMGIKLNAVRAFSFMLSGMIGAIGGIIVAPIVLTQYDSGISLGIKGFVACIIGGFGNPIGAALGGLLLGVLEAMSSGLVSSGLKNAISFILLVLFLLLRPGGILGDLERAKS